MNTALSRGRLAHSPADEPPFGLPLKGGSSRNAPAPTECPEHPPENGEKHTARFCGTAPGLAGIGSDAATARPSPAIFHVRRTISRGLSEMGWEWPNLNQRLVNILFSTCGSLFDLHWKRSLRTVSGSGGSMPRTRKGPASESAIAFLKACRKALGLTQGDLAERTGVSQQQVSKCEGGKSQVPLELVRTLEGLSGRSFESFERSTIRSGSARKGFAAKAQRGYMAEGSREIRNGSGGQQGEPMMLDLRPIVDPADRQRIRDLYAALSHKRGGT